VIGQPEAPAAFPPLPTEYEAILFTDLVWNLWKTETLFTFGIRNQDDPGRSLVNVLDNSTQLVL
jgi:hypothetical protein